MFSCFFLWFPHCHSGDCGALHCQHSAPLVCLVQAPLGFIFISSRVTKVLKGNDIFSEYAVYYFPQAEGPQDTARVSFVAFFRILSILS